MAEPYTVVPLSPLRKAIAARMAEATRTIPHFRLMTEIEMDDLLVSRERANDVAHQGSKISVNDCLIKACALALTEHPRVNVQLVQDTVHEYHDADISVVVAIDDGLVTPVVRGANRKSVQDIAEEMGTLISRANSRQLKMNEIVGGSFSMSNLGGHGVAQFDAIINPPQCAILAVGRARHRIVVTESRETRIATVLHATLSVDHRVIDGAVGGAFLTTLRHIIERPHRIFAGAG